MASRWSVVTVMVMALGAGCGEEQARGTRGGACYADNTCDPGLVCAYDECIIGNTSPACGDGIVNTSSGEQCDDGTANGDDRDCRADCQLNLCGDGHANTAGPARVEECDDGNDDNADGCSTSCTAPSCGNGITDMDEACDDGNAVGGDGCSATCARESCGDGVVSTGEVCDAAGASATCDLDCTPAACGDGVVNVLANEQCDDGMNNGDDRDCTAGCQLNVCGDGMRNSVGPARIETCDDGNTISTDACSTTCTAPMCGNGIIEMGEACDDANDDELDGCTSACAYTQETKVCLNGTSGHGTSEAVTPFAVLGAATIELWYRSADPATPAAETVDLVYFHPAAPVGGDYPGILVELASASAVNMPSLSGRVLLVGVDARGGPQDALNVRGFDIDASLPGFDEKGWHHYAVVFTGTTVRAFIDGVELTTTEQRDGSAAATFASAFGPTFATTYGDLFMSIGYFARDSIRYARGGFRELRVSKTARYTASFTPAFRHAVDADALLLLPMNETTGAVSNDRGSGAYDVTWSGGFTRSALLLACP